MNRKWNCSNLGHFKIKCIWPHVKNTSSTCFFGISDYSAYYYPHQLIKWYTLIWFKYFIPLTYFKQFVSSSICLVDIIITVFLIQEDSPSPPALSFKIEQNYFENNINNDENNFLLADGFYYRTISQDELVLAFDTSDDGKLYRQWLGWIPRIFQSFFCVQI